MNADRARMAFHGMCAMIDIRRQHCIEAGVDPTEVWLGPDEMEVVKAVKEDYLTYRVTDTDRRSGSHIMGLRVRESVENGIRVGWSAGEVAP